jgi:hypothetical protein
LFTSLRDIVIYVYFEFTVPLKVYSVVLIFLNINPRCSNCSALLPTTAKIFQRCCPQHRKIISVVAYNGDNFSALWTTARKSTLISVRVHFSALLPTTQKNYRRC